MTKRTYDPTIYGVDGGYKFYLDRWRALFGEETTGEYHYYELGVQVPCTVHRLTVDEYDSHVQRSELHDAAFQRALAREDDDAMEEALSAAFPHELALLL